MKNLQARGLTLIEILVSLTISIFISFVLIQVYFTNSHTYFVNETLSAMQEDARFINFYLGKIIRTAGYNGCVRRNPDFFGTTGDEGNFRRLIFASEAQNTSPNNTVGLTGNEIERANNDLLVPNINTLGRSDAFTIIVANGELSSPISSVVNNNTVRLSNPAALPTTLPNNGQVIVADCNAARLFSNTTYQQNSGLLTGVNAVGLTLANAEVIATNQLTFFIGLDPNGIPTLYRQVGGSNTREALLPNVENMQVLYGVDTTGNGLPNQYVTGNRLGLGAGQIDPNRVIIMNISLILRSGMDNLRTVATNENLRVAGTTIVTPNDRRYRQVVNMTFNVRNPSN